MKHTLNDYIALLEERSLLAAPVPEDMDRSAPVKLVSYDSREVVPGTLFICKGAHFKEEFLQMARDRGAIAYVSEQPYPSVNLPCLQVNDMRRTIAPLADLFFDHPSGRLKVIGLTGTKGKSSTAYYLKSILDDYMAEKGGPESGIISSIDTYDGVERFESHITTPDALDLQRHFARAVEAGLEYLTMEVSSQALKYHRSLCTDFAAAVFLNIGYDHISPIEHTDFEDYFSAKLRIFAQGTINCVNLDCDHVDRILAGHGVYGQKGLVNLQIGRYLLKLRHHVLIYVKTARSVQNQYVEAVLPGVLISAPGNVHRLLVLSHGEYFHALLFSVYLELPDGSRAVDVAGGQQGLSSLGLELPGDLGRCGGLAGALKAHHHQDGYFIAAF